MNSSLRYKKIFKGKKYIQIQISKLKFMNIMNCFPPYKWFKAKDYYDQSLVVSCKLLDSRKIKKTRSFYLTCK